MAIFAFGVGVWAWPYWQAKNDVPANTNGTMVTNENASNANVDTTSRTNINGVNENTSVPANTNETNVDTHENVNATPKYAAPISENERTHGDESKKEVVFTFDAGAGTQSAQAILDALREHNVPGVFFVTGAWAQKNTGLVKKINLAGHEIYNHTMTHPHLPSLDDKQIARELEQTETMVKTATGKTTKPYFRAPYGDRNAHVLSIAAEQGYTSVYWTTDALDWEESTGVTADQVKNRVVKNLRSGAIFLMHVGDTLTGAVLDDVITETQRLGYSIVRLDRALE